MSVARRRWLIRDETGRAICTLRATDRDDAIAQFCAPALKPEAYFGPRHTEGTTEGTTEAGGWTVEESAP